MKKITSLLIMMLLSLTACVQTDQLYAVHNGPKPIGPRDDAPRIYLDKEQVKASFNTFLDAQCSNLKSPNWQVTIKPGPDGHAPADTDWAHMNPISAVCAARVAAYAVDQCRYMTLQFNRAVLSTKVLVQSASIAAALATDGLALAHPNASNKTATAALAAAVAGNAGNVGSIGDPLTVSPGDMIDAAPKYGEAIGLDDGSDFPKAAMSSSAPAKLARLHDAVLSMCSANLLGTRRLPRR